MDGKVLIIAGSDSGGGAGIQADIKSVTALKGFAMTAITALTAQNTLGVQDVLGIDPTFISKQITSIIDDLGADAVKTGMLHSADVIAVVAEAATTQFPDIPLVVDPVMVAKGGAALLQDEAVEALRSMLVPLATVLTPNLPEAGALLGRQVAEINDMKAAAKDLLALGPQAVLLKGGHLEGDTLLDLLIARDGTEVSFTGNRIHSTDTHGTGCTLASAIATGLAQRLSLTNAIARARAYVQKAITGTRIWRWPRSAKPFSYCF
jgi:hydroxymethylpyrimidine/phosphomethylpyrimidine kinase